ncbi:Rab family GTPase [Thraustotheca clavata]|uniref:Rab family GTPase n=1 Tax=Thraustotheca clavata TaxID=74557 RepID=A0A1W0A618_9STRA|nr:Rab family GTPase [Thraustotheca clavata]
MSDLEHGMTRDQLKSNLYASLTKEGAVDQIRAQLRTNFVQKLQRKSMNGIIPPIHECSLLEKMANSIICQYLEARQLNNTLSVFVPEVGSRNCDVVPEMIKKLLGSSNQVESVGLLEILQYVESLSIKVLHDMETQTVEDDRRLVLESQLKHIEDMYIVQSQAIKEKPMQSLEDRMIQYQQEYDRMAQIHMTKEIERIREMEIAMMRVEERKKYNTEVEAVRSAFQEEYARKNALLDQNTQAMQVEYLEKQRQAELDLFELRQTLLAEMNKVQQKERQLTSQIEMETLKWQNEERRLVLLQDNLVVREKQLEATIERLEAEKTTHLKHIEKECEEKISHQKEELTMAMEKLTKENEAVRNAQTENTRFHQKMAALEVDLLKWKGIETDQKLKLDQLGNELTQHKRHCLALQTELQNVTTERETLNAQLSVAQDKLVRYEREAKAMGEIHTKHTTELQNEIQTLQKELHSVRASNVAVRMEGAEALITTKEQLLARLESEKQSWHAKEQGLMTQLQQLTAKCSDGEALAHRYRVQFEDEQAHVAALRHEIASLNTLVTSLKYAAPSRGREYHPQQSFSYQNTWQRVPQSSFMIPQYSEAKPSSPKQFEPAPVHIQPSQKEDEDLIWKQRQEKQQLERERALEEKILAAEMRLLEQTRQAEQSRIEAEREKQRALEAAEEKAKVDQTERDRLILEQKQLAQREQEAREVQAKKDHEEIVGRQAELEAQRERDRIAHEAQIQRERLQWELDTQKALQKERDQLDKARELAATQAKEFQERLAQSEVKTTQSLTNTSRNEAETLKAISSNAIHDDQTQALKKAQEAEELAAQIAQQEAEAKAKKEVDDKAKVEAEARAIKEAQDKALKEAEDKAIKEAQENAFQEAQKKALKDGEEKALKEAQEKALKEAEDKARAIKVAEEKAAKEAEEKALKEAEEKALKEAEDKKEAEARADKEAKEKAAKEAQERVLQEAQDKALKEAEDKALKEAIAIKEAQEKAIKEENETKEKAIKEAQDQALLEAQAKEKADQEEKARLNAEASKKASQDQSFIDDYRQRVIARRAAERQRQEEAKAKEEEDKRLLESQAASDKELLEDSSGSSNLSIGVADDASDEF